MKELFFIHLTTKDQLTRKCADYLPKIISLKLDFKMVSFLLKFGNRHFSLCKHAS